MPRTALIRSCVFFAPHGALPFGQSEWSLHSLQTSSNLTSIAYDGKTLLAALRSRDVCSIHRDAV